MKQKWNPDSRTPLVTRLRCALVGHKDDRRSNDRREVYWVCRRCGRFEDRAPGTEYAPGTISNGSGGM